TPKPTGEIAPKTTAKTTPKPTGKTARKSAGKAASPPTRRTTRQPTPKPAAHPPGVKLLDVRALERMLSWSLELNQRQEAKIRTALEIIQSQS
ncbi:MAG: hypothetical protein K8S55_00485, partial [Phycisphaerae bacterium]|nr:hypothetical protein [Phycisphaerae bacterium]